MNPAMPFGDIPCSDHSLTALPVSWLNVKIPEALHMLMAVYASFDTGMCCSGAHRHTTSTTMCHLQRRRIDTRAKKGLQQLVSHIHMSNGEDVLSLFLLVWVRFRFMFVGFHRSWHVHATRVHTFHVVWQILPVVFLGCP